MKIFSMAVRMRGAKRRVKGWYSRKGGEVVDLSFDISRLRCYLMKIFSTAVRMRGARRRVKGRYNIKG
jgi:hypothetical protein